MRGYYVARKKHCQLDEGKNINYCGRRIVSHIDYIPPAYPYADTYCRVTYFGQCLIFPGYRVNRFMIILCYNIIQHESIVHSKINDLNCIYNNTIITGQKIKTDFVTVIFVSKISRLLLTVHTC